VQRFRAAGGKGLNITLPFKQEAFGLCRIVSERARRAQAGQYAGARKPASATTPTASAWCAIAEPQPAPSGRWLLLGAGGAAQGVVGPLLDAGASRLVIANRTASKAKELAERFPGCCRSGLRGIGRRIRPGDQRDPLPASSTKPHPCRRGCCGPVFSRTTWCTDAKRPSWPRRKSAGARTSDGLGMLVEQAAEVVLHLARRAPADAPVLAELRGS
jgi:shikimate dehydrogenase